MFLQLLATYWDPVMFTKLCQCALRNSSGLRRFSRGRGTRYPQNSGCGPEPVRVFWRTEKWLHGTGLRKTDRHACSLPINYLRHRLSKIYQSTNSVFRNTYPLKFFPHGITALSGPGHLTVEASRSHSRHTTVDTTPLDE